MLGDLTNMATIRVSKRIPPFHNAVLFEYECTIAEALRAMAHPQEAERYENYALSRARAMNKYLWNEDLGFYLPYDTETGPVFDPSLQDGTFLLESGVAPPHRAARIRRVLKADFLNIGGLRSSLRENSKQSWSSYNCWPNLQISGAKGAWLYKDSQLEESIISSFTPNQLASLRDTGYGKERYDATHLGKKGKGGEYKVPDHNFSWDAAAGVILRRKGYQAEKERRSWQRRRNIADGVGRLAVPN